MPNYVIHRGKIWTKTVFFPICQCFPLENPIFRAIGKAVIFTHLQSRFEKKTHKFSHSKKKLCRCLFKIWADLNGCFLTIHRHQVETFIFLSWRFFSVCIVLSVQLTQLKKLTNKFTRNMHAMVKLFKLLT